MATLYVDAGYITDNYTLDDVYIDWGNKIIHVPKVFLTLIQSVPTVIYQMDLNDFRLKLKDLEDDFEGIPFLDTHKHNTTVSVGGVELARVIEIINGYTVTFEDDQYAVNLIGANSNVGDVVNVNQVSVRTANSAGLVTSQAIEYSEYNGTITVDVINGVSGTIYPTGTSRRPVNNIPDAVIIAQNRGISKLYIVGDITLDTGDNIENYILIGENANKTTITINSGAKTINCEIHEATITGDLDGNTIIRNSVVQNINYITGFIFNSLLSDNSTISLHGSTTAYFLQCYSGSKEAPVIIDMNGTTNDQATPLTLHSFSGSLKLIEQTTNGHADCNFQSGNIIIDSTCTNGHIHVSGNCQVTDDLGDHMSSGTHNGNLLLINNAVSGEHLHEMWTEMGLDPDNASSGELRKQVWDAPIADHAVTGSFGYYIQKKLLTVAKFLGLK